MSQSSPTRTLTVATTGGSPPTRGPVASVVTALALALVLPVVAMVDQVSTHSLSDHATAMYAPHGVGPRDALLYAPLYLIAGLGTLLWWAVLKAIRSHTRFAPAAAAAATATATNATLSLALLIVTEYGTRMFPPVWSVLAALPSAAGIVAVGLLVAAKRVPIASGDRPRMNVMQARAGSSRRGREHASSVSPGHDRGEAADDGMTHHD